MTITDTRPDIAAVQKLPPAQPPRSRTPVITTVLVVMAVLVAGIVVAAVMAGRSHTGRPAGLQRAGKLYTGCTLVSSNNYVTGAVLKLWNPGPDPVDVSQAGIEQISNGVAAGSSAVPGFTPFSLHPHQSRNIPVSFATPSAATSCLAGWA